MTFLDTSALVRALLEKHPQHAACLRALQEAANPVSDAHALAETFATLTGFYKVPSEAAAELTLGLRAVVQIDPLSLADYETAISEARQRGIMAWYHGGWHLRFTPCNLCPTQRGQTHRHAQSFALCPYGT